MTVPVLVIVGTDLRACRYAVRLPLEQLNWSWRGGLLPSTVSSLRHAGPRQIPAALRALIDMIRQAPHPAGSPCAMPGQIGPVAWRSSADIAAKAA
jgi:hypothetical protein